MLQNSSTAPQTPSQQALQAAQEAVRRAEENARAARSGQDLDHLAGSRKVIDNYRERQQAERLQAEREALLREERRRRRPPVPPRIPACSPRNQVRANALALRPQVSRTARATFATMLGGALDRLCDTDHPYYADGIQALWPTSFQGHARDLVPLVQETVVLLILLRAKGTQWTATEELRFFNTVLFMEPIARGRVRVLVNELWVPTTFLGAMEDLKRLGAAGPIAGAFLNERRRFVKHASDFWLEAFAQRNGEERAQMHGHFPARERDTSMPAPPEVYDATEPEFPSPLRESFTPSDGTESPPKRKVAATLIELDPTKLTSVEPA